MDREYLEPAVGPAGAREPCRAGVGAFVWLGRPAVWPVQQTQVLLVWMMRPGSSGPRLPAPRPSAVLQLPCLDPSSLRGPEEAKQE